MDAETGLYNYGARYYDPSLSIWSAVDPLADKFNSWSPYHYATNNPINIIDYDGRDTIPAGAGFDTDYLTMPQDNVQVNSVQLTNKLDVSNRSEPLGLNLKNSKVGVGIIASGMEKLHEMNSTVMYKKGIRPGLSGNYQLSPRLTNLFKDRPITNFVRPTTAVGRYAALMAGFSRRLGYVGMAYSSYQYMNGEISGGEAAFSITSTAMSMGVAAFYGTGYGALFGGISYIGYDIYTRPLNPPLPSVSEVKYEVNMKLGDLARWYKYRGIPR